MSNTTSNMFQNLAFSYNDLLSDITSKLPRVYTKYELKSKYSVGSIKVDIDKSIKNDINMYYKIITDSINTDNDTDWLKMVMNFIEFIRISEKCFMFNNDDTNSIYADIDTKTSTSILYCIINQLGCKLRISFQDSAINIIDTTRNSSLLGFINGDDQENNNVIFIQLDIGREFGKCMKNEYKFILGSSIPFNDDTDKVLYENSKKLISGMIFNCLIDILNNYISKIHDIDINIKDVLENDRLWIRK